MLRSWYALEAMLCVWRFFTKPNTVKFLVIRSSGKEPDKLDASLIQYSSSQWSVLRITGVCWNFRRTPIIVSQAQPVLRTTSKQRDPVTHPKRFGILKSCLGFAPPSP